MSLSIEQRECSRFHFVGILGSGMSAIAQFLRWENCSVSGSDRSLDSADTASVRSHLATAGCTLVAQDGTGVKYDPDVVVVSTAIEADNPDIAEARARSIPVVHRSDVLAALVKAHRTVAVAGTSGKSTVTGLVFDILDGCGRSPSVISGANLSSLAGRGVLGNAWHGSSDLLVIEADESDGTVVKYQPHLSLLLNVSKDHKSVEETVQMMRTLAGRSAVVIVNAEDSHCSQIPHASSFGLRAGTLHPESIERTVPDISFNCNGLRLTSPLPGEHNLSNVLAALAACHALGCECPTLAQVLAGAGRLSRRFEQYPTSSGIVVIDDFAHNPAKIEAALRTAQAMAPRVFALFQPHGFGPTRFMRDELVDVLKRVPRPADRCALLPIYYAGGTAQRDISSEQLAQAVGPSCTAPQTREQCVAWLKSAAAAGDMVLSMGARDPSLPGFARLLAQEL